MTLYEKNLKFFKENSKAIYDMIFLENSTYDSKVEHVANPSNLVVENENKRCFINSIYNRKREICKMFQHVKGETERIIVFGTGLFEYVDYVSENYKKLVELIVIEPDLNVFKCVIEHVDIEKVMHKIGKIIFIIGKNEEEAFNILVSSVSYKFVQSVELVYNLSYRSLYSGYYEKFSELLIKYARNTLVDIATRELFLYTWPENIINNIRHDALLIEKFLNKFIDIPVIIVSAGPSLNYTMEYLKKLKNKALIVAVGSAIKILDSNGIIPHFRMAFDGLENERKIFNDIDTESSILIFSDLINYKILNEYKGQKVRMVVDTDLMSQYFYKKLNGTVFLTRSGFSIANVALDAFIKLGAKKIIFIGQDLCYTEGKLYAKGSWHNENSVNFENTTYIEVNNVLGEKVNTTKQFLGMKDLLEEIIKLNPEVSYINCTEKGLNIKGAENRKFIDVVEEELKREFNIENIINETFNENFNAKGVKLNNLVKEINEQLNKLNKLNDDRIIRLKKIEKYLKKNLGINRLKNEIKYVKTIEKQLGEIEFYREAIKPMIFYKYKAIYMANHYNGDDERILVEKNLNALKGRSMELKMYLQFLLQLLKNQIY